jgi:lysophospholipase L1-like esterase
MSEAKPYIPKWADMFPAEIEKRFSLPVEVINTAVGGKTSLWGKEAVQEAVVAHHPDLAVIGFGMNDGTNQIAPEIFNENIRYMIDKIREDRPDSTILVLNCILPNKEMVRYCDGIQEAYTPILQKIENDYKEIAFADIMELHQYLLKSKKYADMTGNNINHVNDFMSRLYSQTLFRTIQK